MRRENNKAGNRLSGKIINAKVRIRSAKPKQKNLKDHSKQSSKTNQNKIKHNTTYTNTRASAIQYRKARETLSVTAKKHDY